MAKRATWTVGAPKSSKAQDGTITLTVPVSDAGVKQADMVWVLTPDRALTVTWKTAPGAVPLTDFRAWIKEA